MSQPDKNGLLSRRLFLQKGAVFSSAALAASKLLAESPLRFPSMRLPGRTFSPYGQPSEFEKAVIRWSSANSMAAGNGVSWTPLHQMEGMITPNGLHFERHHNGIPDIDPDTHQLLIHGLVKRPLAFALKDLERYPMRSFMGFIECGGNSNAGWRSQPLQTAAGFMHGMASCSEWTGVPLSILLQETGLRQSARWLVAEGADAAIMNISLSLEKALDDCLLALYQNGEHIRPENGYPLRLIVPGWEGVTHVKWLRRLHVTDRPVMARNETAKYTELLPSGKARQFTFVMEAKSLITSTCVGHRLAEHGVYPIKGLAWSGRGKVKRVEVTADGGKTWEQAELQQPVLDKCFTRFRIPWRWQGQEAVLKSRVTDESGYVQPERAELIRQRGRHGYFHYNAIVSWQVTGQGEILHVY